MFVKIELSIPGVPPLYWDAAQASAALLSDSGFINSRLGPVPSGEDGQLPVELYSTESSKNPLAANNLTLSAFLLNPNSKLPIIFFRSGCSFLNSVVSSHNTK